MTTGDAHTAPSQFDEAIAALTGSDSPADLAMLGGLLYADDRFDETRTVWEHGFTRANATDDAHTAARLSIALIDLHTSVLGNPSAGNGWRARAKRQLDRIGPCVEWGYYELAVIACARPDAADLMASTDRALALAAEYGDRALEARALAEGGLALVSYGRAADGFERLDEALAIICSGEVADVAAVGRVFCAMLTSCERANDLNRAEEWIRLVQELVLSPNGGRPRILHTHCSAAYGAVLCGAGRWDEAESAMQAVLGPKGSRSMGHRLDTVARLAQLRVAQGRLDDAAALLAPYEDRLAAWQPLAELHLRRGDPDLAAVLARRALDLLVADVARRTPLLALLVETEIARGDWDAARLIAEQLDASAEAIGTPTIRAEAAIARARVLAATDDHRGAAEQCRRASAALDAGDLPLTLITVHRLHAEALAADNERAGAVAEARAALAIAQRLGATIEADRLAALLRTLGVMSRPRVEPAGEGRLAGLTTREAEVLTLLQAGCTNSDIGAQLFISPKTVEHHVGRILVKLGVRSRAEAAAVAASAVNPDSNHGVE